MRDTPKLARLDKCVADMLAVSRAEARRAIRAGEIAVGGNAASNPEERIDPTRERIAWHDRELAYREHVYLMLNKPAGYLCAARDARLPTVAELVPAQYGRFAPFPVGRLDSDTTGLLIMTDDGALAHALMSPKSRVEKEYEATVDRDPFPGAEEAFANGVTIAGGIECMPARLRRVSPGIVRVTVVEGKHRQVRRMLLAYGSRTLGLRRVRLHSVELDPSLQPGATRELSECELSALRAALR